MELPGLTPGEFYLQITCPILTAPLGVDQIAGEHVQHVRSTDGLKVYLENSWFLVRPSGTENILKIYAETFVSESHLQQLIAQVRQFLKL